MIISWKNLTLLKTFWEIGHEEILSTFGKVTVIKSIALPTVLIQCLTVLPHPPSNVIIEIQKEFFKFI